MGKNRFVAPAVAAGTVLTLVGAYGASTTGLSKASAPQQSPAPAFSAEEPGVVGALLAGLSERTALHVAPIAAKGSAVAAETAPPQLDRNLSDHVPANCRPATGLLSRNPVRAFGLPGGASVQIWDTGARANPMDETRLVAVRIPKETLTPTVLTPSSALGRLARPSSMADDHGRAVVVINGGVYDTRTNIPTGALDVDDKPRKADSLGSRAIAIYDGLKSAVVARTGLTGLLSGAHGDTAVSAINWETLSRHGLSAYTHAWDAASHPAGPRTVVVKDGRVRAVLARAAGLRRPGAGETFLTAPAGSRYLAALEALRVGDAVTLHTAVSSVREDHSDRPVLDQPSALLGVSAALVRYGKVIAPCSARDNQLRPRSAVAWNANGDMLVVSVAGRALVGGSRYGGASAYGWGQYLRQLGAVSAVNLDGGGSTALLVRREVGGPLHRIDRDDDAAQRPVANALAFRVG